VDERRDHAFIVVKKGSRMRGTRWDDGVEKRKNREKGIKLQARHSKTVRGERCHIRRRRRS